MNSDNPSMIREAQTQYVLRRLKKELDAMTDQQLCDKYSEALAAEFAKDDPGVHTDNVSESPQSPPTNPLEDLQKRAGYRELYQGLKPLPGSIKPLPTWELHWGPFCDIMTKRLEAGHKAYGDVSFHRPPDELDREIDEEILDVIGWAYVKWVARRIRRSGS